MNPNTVPADLGQARQWAADTLRQSPVWTAHNARSDAPVDADVLLCHVLAKPRVFLFTWPDHRLTPAQQNRLSALIQRRAQGEPVAYLTGQRAFWTLDLLTENSTLIPRPDTETLVQAVLDRVPAGPLDVVDLGTGTGAIALALASERPAWRVTGLDRVPAAVALAQRNAVHTGMSQVRFQVSDWCGELADHSVDVLVSNPPYVASDDPHLGQGDVRFEPTSALTAEEQGMADFRSIVQQSLRVLRAGGWLFFEHGYEQADDVVLLLIDAGFEHIATVADLGQQPRVTFGRLPSRIV